MGQIYFDTRMIVFTHRLEFNDINLISFNYSTIECPLHIKYIANDVGGSIRNSFNTKQNEKSIINDMLKVPFGGKGRRDHIYLVCQLKF